MLGSISTGTDEDEENDKIVVVEDDDEEDFLHLPERGAVTNGGESNSCFNPLLEGLPLVNGHTSVKLC